MNDSASQRAINIRYFAWVREKTGIGQEKVVLPAHIITVADLVAWLRSRGPEFAEAFHKPDIIRAALDQAHVKNDAQIGNSKEVGFFPPVTGG